MSEKGKLTDQQKIAYLAEKVMGWPCLHPLYEQEDVPGQPKRFCKRCQGMFLIRDWHVLRQWNPLTDWNHWRQVEEKVMEADGLFYKFKKHFWDDKWDPFLEFMKADLPTRVDALISAHQALLHG